MKTRFIRATLAACLAAMALSTASAWDGAVNGTIIQLDGLGSTGGAPGNFDFRIYISGGPLMCTGAAQSGWAYVNSTDANYKALVSMLLTAYVMGKNVTVYSNLVNSECQIGYIKIIG